MLHIIRGFGDEKSQLRELNSRLDQYLSRVRQLETENHLLVEEIHRLRLERGAEWAQGYRAEMCQLRKKVEELTVERCEVEIQRDNLWHELQTLQALWEQVRSMRLSIEQQLNTYKNDLQKARSSQAALEELYIRLQQECKILHGSHQEDLLVLREKALNMPLHVAMQGTLRPSLSLQEVQSFSLEISSHWEETFLLYQKKIKEMEENLRLEEKKRMGAEEEVRAQSLQVEVLRREYEELQRIRKILEDELLKMKEKYRLEVEEYLIIIEELESERDTIRVSITDRLKDYQELMQLKTGLSLEVSAYRALLESESKSGKVGTVIWTDRSARHRPPGYVTTSSIQQSSYSGMKRGEERKQIPMNRSNDDIRRKIQTTNVQRIQPRTVPQTVIRSKTTDIGRTNNSYAHQVEQKAAVAEKSDAYSRRYDFQSIYPSAPAKVVKPYSTRQSTEVTESFKHGQVRDLKPSIVQTEKSKEISIGQTDIRVDDKINIKSSHQGLESKVVEEKKVETKVIEVERNILQDEATYLPTKEQNKKESAANIAEKAEIDSIKEHKVQELPVKKERKKREQVKKRQEETEKTQASDTSIATEEKVETHESPYTETHIGLKEKSHGHQFGLNIPIIFEVNKKDDNSHKSHVDSTCEDHTKRTTKKTYINEEASLLKSKELHESSTEAEVSETPKADDSEVVIRSLEHMAEKEMVDNILRHFGQPSVLDNASVTYVENKQQNSDGSVKTEIFIQSKTKEEVDFYNDAGLLDMWGKNTKPTEQDSRTGDEECLLEEIRTRNVTKTKIPGGLQEADPEDWIGNIIHAELKGRPGMSVNVEIIEESIGSFGIERPELSTPFQVEEAEDSYQGAEPVDVEEQQHTFVKAEKQKDKIQPIEITDPVEEVTESHDMDDETSYFVSIPDDNHTFQDEEEEMLRGQIHIEEESHVKYSWQDEFLQGSQNRKALSELLKSAATNEPDATIPSTVDDSSIYKLEKEEPKEEKLLAETIVIEKEIRVPHELQSSLKSLLSKNTKDPQQQLKGALECLQGSLPQDLAKELSDLAGDEQVHTTSIAMDIKKVDQTVDSGVVTIVAEINVSQTMDTDNFEVQNFTKGDSKQNGAVSHSTVDTAKEIRAFHGNTEKEISEDKQDSYNSNNFGPNHGVECFSSEETIHKRPESTSIHLSPTEMHLSPDVSRFIKHIELGSSEFISLEKSISDIKEQGSAEELSPTDTNRSFHHIKLGPREMYSAEQIIFEGPISETLKFDEGKNTEDSTEQNKSIRHIKISPTDKFPTEQIIFEGPLFKTGESSTAGSFSLKERHTGDRNQSTQNIKIGFEEFQTDEQENRSRNLYQTEPVRPANKTITHFTINPGETQLKEFLFAGTIPKVQEIIRESPQGAEEDSRPIEHNIDSQTIHIAKQAKYKGMISEPFKMGEAGNFAKTEEQSTVNTSVHHIKLSPNREQIIFEGPISENFGQEEGTRDSNSSIRHFHVGAKQINNSKQIMFEGPASETYETSDVQISSPSGDSSESERSIKHIKLGPTEKSFTFQMDITKIATKYQGEADVQETAMVVTSQSFEGQPEKSQSYHELTDESGYGEEEISAISQYPYEVESQSEDQQFIDTTEFNKTVQLQRIVGQRSMASDDQKMAVVYLDEDEEPDQDYLRRSF